MRIRVVVAVLLLASSAAPALAQSKPPIPARNDPCAPIGKTARGELVYSMKCDRMPVPAAPVAAVPAPVPAPVAEEDKGGLFRNPFPSLIRPASNDDREAGVGPPPSSR